MSNETDDEAHDSTTPGCRVGDDRCAAFVLRDDAADAAVAGDFTDWQPVPMRRTGDLWVHRTAPLTPGAHAYKYVVDGRWREDAAHPLGRADGVGGRNSAFVVGDRPLGAPEAVRVASLNLHTYQEPDPLAQLERAAFGVAALGVDVVLLSEVGEHVSDPGRPNAGEVVRGHLAHMTGRDWHHAWRMAHVGFDVYREGVSLLSTAPLDDVAVHPLSDGFFARIALAATTQVRGLTLRVVSTHTSWGADGEREVDELLRALLAVPATTGALPTLVAGDLNAAPGAAAVRAFGDAGFDDVGAGRTGPTFGDPLSEHIDYQFLRATDVVPSAFRRILDGSTDGYHPRVSDHAGLCAAYVRG